MARRFHCSVASVADATAATRLLAERLRALAKEIADFGATASLSTDAIVTTFESCSLLCLPTFLRLMKLIQSSFLWTFNLNKILIDKEYLYI